MNSTQPNTGRSALKHSLRALRYRNYRLYFGGQMISLIGTWMQMVGVSWLIYRLTNSALLLGIAGFASQIPAFVFAPFAGVLVDRLNRHRILILTQSLSMLQAFVLAALVLTGNISVWHIIFLNSLLGLVNGLDLPARQSFVVEIVEKREDMGNAIALNSSTFNLARLIGPSVAGILIAAMGEGMCFFINGVSYLAVIAALLAMRLKPAQKKETKTGALQELKEGFAYVSGFAPVKFIIALLAVLSLVGMPYAVLMPVFAKKILHGGAHTLGFLMAASGTGALAGGIFLAARKNVSGFGRMIPLSMLLFGAGLTAFSLSRNVMFSLFLLALSGFGMMVCMASCNTLIQMIVEDDKRGRVMSFFIMAFMGMAPLGSLLAGILAGNSRVGAPHTLLLSGILCILTAVLFSRKLPEMQAIIRPIYIQRGIIPNTPS